MIADRPQTIVWAFTLSSRTSIWRSMAIWPSVETLFSITPCHVSVKSVTISQSYHSLPSRQRHSSNHVGEPYVKEAWLAPLMPRLHNIDVLRLSGRGLHSSTFQLTVSLFVGYVAWLK